MENVPCTWFSRQRVSSCLDLASICIVVRRFKFSFQILKRTWFVDFMPLLDGIRHYPKEEVSVVIYLTSAHCVLVC